MEETKKNEKTEDENRLVWNAYMRNYNRRRREENKDALQQVIKIKYENEVLGGKEHE